MSGGRESLFTKILLWFLLTVVVSIDRQFLYLERVSIGHAAAASSTGMTFELREARAGMGDGGPGRPGDISRASSKTPWGRKAT